VWEKERPGRVCICTYGLSMGTPAAEVRDAAAIGQLEPDPQQGLGRIRLFEDVLLVKDTVSLGSRQASRFGEELESNARRVSDCVRKSNDSPTRAGKHEA
jgi:hypothetical protein